MQAGVALSDIETILEFYLHKNKHPVDLSSFPWIQNNLSLFSRFSGFLGGVQRDTWLKKYLFPILMEVSLPHLKRFQEGSWNACEESKLKMLFDFFSVRIDTCRKVFSPELVGFLSGPTPSFFQEKNWAYSGFKEGKEETYQENKKRLQNLIADASKKKKESVQDKAIQETQIKGFLPLSKKTKERLDKALEEFHKLRDACVEQTVQIERDFSKVFPLRYDFESLVTDLQKRKETLFSLLLHIEEEIAKLSEKPVVADEENALNSLEEASLLLKRYSLQGEEMKEGLLECRARAEESRALLLKRIHLLVRAIDCKGLLSSTSAFRQHQARVIRTARDKVKKYKDSLSRGPGPGIFFADLEKEIFLLLDLAQQFYEEGAEVEKMREKLSALYHHLEMLVEQEVGLKKTILKGVLVDINELKNTLEISSDRTAHFNRIVHAVSEFSEKIIPFDVN